jgi:hypothetical protein
MSDFSGFYSARFVAELDDVVDKLGADLEKLGRSSMLIAIVFANGDKDFVKKEVLPLVGYWNYRSRDFICFFFVGWVGDPRNDGTEYGEGITDGDFSSRAFVEAIESMENQSKWKYQGDTPLLLLRGFRQYDEIKKKQRAYLDMHSVIEFELERAIREHAIDSVESFFEIVIAVARATPGDYVQWKLSDKLGPSALGDTLLAGISSKLPGAPQLVHAIRFFRVKNLDS